LVIVRVLEGDNAAPNTLRARVAEATNDIISYDCEAVTTLLYVFPQSARVTPAGTTVTTPVEALITKSVVSPVMEKVTALPSPPVTDAVLTRVPPATVQASVAEDGLRMRASAGGVTVIDNVPETEAADAPRGLISIAAAAAARRNLRMMVIL
jgi:hypothetical protein